MFGSSKTIRRLAGLAGIAGAMVLVPVAQANSGFNGSPDAIDRAIAARQAELGSSFQGSPDAIDRAVATRQSEQAAAFDAREHAQLALSPASRDVVERTVRAHQLNFTPDLSGMPDVVERTVAAGQLQYLSQPTTSSGFDWNEFGIGAGAGIGLMLLLLGVGASVWITRQGEREVSSI
jgi:hypothetical protein